jgi:hypothetical protein
MATDYQFEQWNKKFKWFFIKWAFRKLKYMETDADIATARDCFVNLSKIGALSNPPYKWAEKLREDILGFIGEK